MKKHPEPCPVGGLKEGTYFISEGPFGSHTVFEWAGGDGLVSGYFLPRDEMKVVLDSSKMVSIRLHPEQEVVPIPRAWIPVPAL